MKKVILTIIGGLTTSVTFCQIVESTETERIIDKYTGKFGDAIQKLAIALKTPAEHVYEVLIRQQTVQAYVSIGYFIILTVSGIFVCKLFLKDYEEQGEIGDCSLLTAVSGILWIVLTFSFFVSGSFSDIFQGLINPEYGAIKEIANMVNPVPAQ